MKSGHKSIFVIVRTLQIKDLEGLRPDTRPEAPLKRPRCDPPRTRVMVAYHYKYSVAHRVQSRLRTVSNGPERLNRFSADSRIPGNSRQNTVEMRFRLRSVGSLWSVLEASSPGLLLASSAQAQVTAPLGWLRTMLWRKRIPFSKPSCAVIKLSSCSMESAPS